MMSDGGSSVTSSIRAVLKSILKLSFEQKNEKSHFSDLIYTMETAVEDHKIIREQPVHLTKTILALSATVVITYLIYLLILFVYEWLIGYFSNFRGKRVVLPGDLLPTVPADRTNWVQRPKTLKRMNEPVEVCLIQNKASGSSTPKALSPRVSPTHSKTKLHESPPKKPVQPSQNHTAISDALEKKEQKEKEKTPLVPKENDIPLVTAVKATSLTRMDLSQEDLDKIREQTAKICAISKQEATPPSDVLNVPIGGTKTPLIGVSGVSTTIAPKDGHSIASSPEVPVSPISIPPAVSHTPGASSAVVTGKSLSPKTAKSASTLSTTSTQPTNSLLEVTVQPKSPTKPTTSAPSALSASSASLSSLPTSLSSNSSASPRQPRLSSETAQKSTRESKTSSSSPSPSPRGGQSTSKSARERKPAGTEDEWEPIENTQRSDSSHSLSSLLGILSRCSAGSDTKKEDVMLEDDSLEKKKTRDAAKNPVLALMQMYPEYSMSAGCGQCQAQPLYPVTFRWHDVSATSVFLTGSFLSWESKIPLKRDRYGWVVELSLPKGHFEYKFIVDRNWAIDDKRQPTILSREGQINHVVHV